MQNLLVKMCSVSYCCLHMDSVKSPFNYKKYCQSGENSSSDEILGYILFCGSPSTRWLLPITFRLYSYLLMEVMEGVPDEILICCCRNMRKWVMILYMKGDSLASACGLASRVFQVLTAQSFLRVQNIVRGGWVLGMLLLVWPANQMKANVGMESWVIRSFSETEFFFVSIFGLIVLSYQLKSVHCMIILKPNTTYIEIWCRLQCEPCGLY